MVVISHKILWVNFMRNRYLDRVGNLVKVRVCGKHISRFVLRIVKEKIQIVRLIPISYREIHLILYYDEYKKMLNISTVLYDISIISYMGSLKLKKHFFSHSIFFFFVLIGVIGLLLLSRVIFFVEVIHEDSNIRNLVMEELKGYHIERFHFKKSYAVLESIEDEILNRHKDCLEWIEIREIGTKYQVMVEERKIHVPDKNEGYYNIVSKKDAVIVGLKVIHGEKVKNVHDYVRRGDIVISGYVTLPNQSKVLVQSEGEVLGEVWYTVKMDYPFVYQESKLTGRSKKTFAFYYFGNRLGLFDFQRYRSFSTKNKILFSSIFLNVQFVLEEQYEMLVKDEVYTEDIVKNKAINYIKEKIMRDNPLIKEVVDIRILNSYSDEDSVQFNIFIKAIEDIGEISYFSPDINQNEQKK